MLSRSEKFIKVFRSLLPAPFTIAVLLTLFIYFIALFFTRPLEAGYGEYAITLFTYWEKDLWGGPYMVFTMQMMLMLVLGHVLALSRPVNQLIEAAVSFCTTTANAAAYVTLLTLCVSFFNWGLGLIFGAIFARKVAEFAAKKGFRLNYPLIGAAGYSGLMVWHGGISGSAPIKVADEGAIKSLVQGSGMSKEAIAALPAQISFESTVFSSMNITISIAILILLPSIMYFIGRRSKEELVPLPSSTFNGTENNHPEEAVTGAEKLTYSRILAIFFGGAIIFYAIYKAVALPKVNFWSFIDPNYINLILIGLCIVFHQTFANFLVALDKAISGAAGILIQFPLYFGILGLMKYSGLMTDISNFFISISNEVTYPLFTFMSAGLVNIFVPSGGGQWAVQGPIIVQMSSEMGVSLPKNIMAMAYGDQLTNMLQPFWALPLLAITGLKARDILPYTLVIMLSGALIFITGLLLF